MKEKRLHLIEKLKKEPMKVIVMRIDQARIDMNVYYRPNRLSMFTLCFFFNC